MSKVTTREILSTVIDANVSDVVTAWAENEIAKLDKRKAYTQSHKGTSKKAVANTALINTIIEAMETGKAYTVSDIIKEIDCAKDLSTQKVSALLNSAASDAGMVTRTVEKRKAYFTKA